MDVKTLNFFQKQYLTYFKSKNVKPKADIYHEIIRFVMENHCSPRIEDLRKKFPTREKTLITDLRYLEEKKMIIKDKVGVDFYFFPVLKPFVTLAEKREEIYTYYADSPTYSRGLKLRDKIGEILNARKQHHQSDWRASFKATGYTDDPRYIAKKNADEYDRGELPPNFDDAEDSSGVVVV